MNEYRQWIILIVIALLGGGGSNYLAQKANPPRPDPFTGSQGRVMEARISARMSSLEEQHQQLIRTITDILSHDAGTHRQIEDHQRRLDHMMSMHKDMVKNTQDNRADDAKFHSKAEDNARRIKEMRQEISRVLREHEENRRSK